MYGQDWRRTAAHGPLQMAQKAVAAGQTYTIVEGGRHNAENKV
jgi:hypothetical protein